MHMLQEVRWTYHMLRVGQNCMYTPYMTVYLVRSLPKILHINRIYIYIYMVLADPTHAVKGPCQKYHIYTVYIHMCK